MILRILDVIGLNTELIGDIMFITIIAQTLALIAIAGTLKGILIPLLKAKYQKKNLAIIDLGGIETPLINYERGSQELEYTHKEQKFTVPIPDGIERMLPNGIKYILISRHIGTAFNIHLMGQQIDSIKKLLNPKNIANTIDDRSKQIADRLTKDVNKPMILATGVAIIFVIVLFGYLIFIKAIEYDIARQLIADAGLTAQTLHELPPLD